MLSKIHLLSEIRNGQTEDPKIEVSSKESDLVSSLCVRETSEIRFIANCLNTPNLVTIGLKFMV